MSRRTKTWVALSAVLVLATLLRFSANRSQPFRLPNTSYFKLRTVTIGTNHQVVLGPWHQRLTHRLLSGLNYKLLGLSFTPPSTRTVPFPEPSVVFWIDHFGSVLELSLANSDWRAVAFNELGSQVEVDVPFYNSYTPTMPWVLRTYPRTGKTLGLRIYIRDTTDTNAWLQVGQVLTRNPTRGPIETWSPQALPQSQHDREVEVSLLNLELGMLPFKVGFRPWREQALINLKVTEHGNPKRNWTPCFLDLDDPTGNHSTSRLIPVGASSNPDAHVIENLLPTDRPWKITVILYPADQLPPLHPILGYRRNNRTPHLEFRGVVFVANPDHKFRLTNRYINHPAP